MKDLGKYRRSVSDFLEVFEAMRTFELTFLATWLVRPFSKAPSLIYIFFFSPFSPKSVISHAYKNYNNIFILTLFIINIIIIYKGLVWYIKLNWVRLN